MQILNIKKKKNSKVDSKNPDKNSVNFEDNNELNKLYK